VDQTLDLQIDVHVGSEEIQATQLNFKAIAIDV